MSRPLFWPTNDSQVADALGYPVAGAAVRVWTRQTGGSPLTDLQYVDGTGTSTGAVPAGVLRSDPNGLLPAFAGPDGGATTVWSDHGLHGVRLALTADPATSSNGSGGVLTDGSVSTAKIQDGAVTPAKLTFDPATQAELDAATSATATALAGKASNTHAATHTGAGSDPLTLAQAQISGLPASLAGKADLIGGVIPTAQLPSLAVTDVTPVATQAAMLALPAQKGDVAVRTDTGQTFILSTGVPTTLADWKEILAVGQVTSVAGKTGVVALAGTDITAGTVPANRLPVGTGAGTVAAGDDARIVGAAQQAGVTTALAGKADLSGGTVPAGQIPTLPQSKVTGLPADLAARIQVGGDISGPPTTPTVPALAAKVQLGGDLAGTIAAPVVARVNGVSVPAAPAAGQILTATSGTAASWSTPTAGVTAAQLAADSAMTGTYAQIVARDVRAHGAVGDGITDDTSAVNAALAAAGPGGTVVIPPGLTVKVSGPIALTSRTITGGGTITATGIATVINASGTMPTLDGVTVIAENCSNGIYVNQNTNGLTVRNCTIGGTTFGPAQALHFNTSGIVGASVVANVFRKVTYGVLTNVGAADLRDLRILGNRFEVVSGDAVELNHPGTAYTGGADVIVDGNYISASAGTGSSAGFGVGIAGATRVVVSNNIFEACRLQGVHIEDEAAHVTVTGNIFTAGGVGVWTIGGSYLSILGNHFYGQAGSAVQFLEDPTTSASYFLVAHNTIYAAGAAGIDVNIDYGVKGLIEGNIVSGCAGDGLWVHSTETSAAVGPLVVRGNQFLNNAGWGMTLDSHTLQQVSNNICDQNTGGPFRRSATSNGILVPIHDPSGCKLDAAFTANTTGWVTMFPLGSRATGNLVVSSARELNSADRCQQVWNLDWDGSTLTATTVGPEVSNGGSTGVDVRVSSGMLQARVGHASVTNGSVVRVWAQMQGVVLL